ncbi:hypothetical protein [Burkholderia sp. Ac-20379]|nr:hypothetical protein [Burkholderia sp. Ac-20379]
MSNFWNFQVAIEGKRGRDAIWPLDLIVSSAGTETAEAAARAPK